MSSRESPASGGCSRCGAERKAHRHPIHGESGTVAGTASGSTAAGGSRNGLSAASQVIWLGDWTSPERLWAPGPVNTPGG